MGSWRIDTDQCASAFVCGHGAGLRGIIGYRLREVVEYVTDIFSKSLLKTFRFM